MQAYQSTDQLPRRQPAHAPTSHSASFERRGGPSDDSWVEISSQPSSSSLSSVGEEVVTAGLRVQHDPRATRRRRTLGAHVPSHLSTATRTQSYSGASSQEEYEESESESDRVMTSSGEGLQGGGGAQQLPLALRSSPAGQVSDDDDENRTAINYPINKNDTCFTPQPNAFSHPPAGSHTRPVSGSYFPSTRSGPRQVTRHSAPLTQQVQDRGSHLPQNILSPSYNAAAQHEEALRASLSTLLSCAAAARGLPKSDPKVSTPAANVVRNNRVEPQSLRLIPESALPAANASPPQFHEPTFQPTIRRSTSTSTSSTSADRAKENKRKARASSRERKAMKKARQLNASASTASDESLSHISPTLLTWVVSAGVVVFISALTFSAGYSLGKEAGRLEAGGFGGAASSYDDQFRLGAREASRSSLGLKRSLARSAVQV